MGRLPNIHLYHLLIKVVFLFKNLMLLMKHFVLQGAFFIYFALSTAYKLFVFSLRFCEANGLRRDYSSELVSEQLVKKNTNKGLSASSNYDDSSNATKLVKTIDYNDENAIMKKTAGTISAKYEDIISEFKKIKNSEALQMSIDELIDFDEDGFHETMKILSRRYKFYYAREKRKS